MSKADNAQTVSLIARREIEAKIVGPLLAGMSARFGAKEVRAVAAEVIKELARDAGRQMAATCGGSLSDFACCLEQWRQEDALTMEMLEQSEEVLAFNVVRCRYAELYRELGYIELGTVLSCNRDFALAEGFNPNIKLERTQTIMEGAPYCDFRFRLQK